MYRASVEINLSNILHNYQFFAERVPNGCEIMAVIKADAYGHGMIPVAKFLSEAGVQTFAVATLAEAVELRANNIEGEILILGFTNLDEINLIKEHNLIQTMVDLSYAQKINEKNIPIRAHIKMDTGMHRIGENFANIENLAKIYALKNLQVEGIFTHLAKSDSKDNADIEFTKKQIHRFDTAVASLRAKGINCGKLHVQNTYGILNYPKLNYDYARVGIGLYSHCEQIPKMRATMQIKARVAMVKEIACGESVGYGNNFIAKKAMKIAVITIGYADGISRMLTNTGYQALIRGKAAQLVGSVCMDQLMVDVTTIADVKANDIITLIGEFPPYDVETVSALMGTIPHEIITRIGNRLEKEYIK
jgi:alanine racemase